METTVELGAAYDLLARSQHVLHLFAWVECTSKGRILVHRV